jgi:hypothetical protein
VKDHGGHDCAVSCSDRKGYEEELLHGFGAGVAAVFDAFARIAEGGEE